MNSGVIEKVKVVIQSKIPLWKSAFVTTDSNRALLIDAFCIVAYKLNINFLLEMYWFIIGQKELAVKHTSDQWVYILNPVE